MWSYQDGKNRQWSVCLDGEYPPLREQPLDVAVESNLINVGIPSS